MPIGKISTASHNIDPILFDTDDWGAEIRLSNPRDLEPGLYLNGESIFGPFCCTFVPDRNTIVPCSSFEDDRDLNSLQRIEEDFEKVLSDTSAKIFRKRLEALRRAAYISRFAK